MKMNKEEIIREELKNVFDFEDFEIDEFLNRF